MIMDLKRRTDKTGIAGLINACWDNQIMKAIVMLLVGVIAGFIGKTFVVLPVPGDYITKTEFSRLEKTVSTTDGLKVDVADYESDKAALRLVLDSKADKATVMQIEKNVDRVLTVMLDPSKAPQVRREVEREKKVKARD